MLLNSSITSFNFFNDCLYELRISFWLVVSENFVSENYLWLNLLVHSCDFALFHDQFINIFSIPYSKSLMRVSLNNLSLEFMILCDTLASADPELFLTIKYTIPQRPISHLQLSFPPQLVAFEMSLETIEGALFPGIDALPIFDALSKSTLKSIPIWICLFPCAMRHVVEPIAFIVVLSVNKFSFATALISVNCSYIVTMSRKHIKTLWTEGHSFREVSFEVLTIFRYDFPQSMRHPSTPLSTIVQIKMQNEIVWIKHNRMFGAIPTRSN